jgi:hypothetical protein
MRAGIVKTESYDDSPPEVPQAFARANLVIVANIDGLPVLWD